MMKDPLNKLIMEEIGLTVDSQSRVIDQDTREHLQFKEKDMKYSSQNTVTVGHNDIIFDPAENKNLMSNLFSHFAKKIEEEDSGYISMYYEKNNEDGKTILEAKTDNGIIQSKPYNNDSLLYLDVIQQLNGSENVDLSEYDSERVYKEPAKTTRTRKKKSTGTFLNK